MTMAWKDYDEFLKHAREDGDSFGNCLDMPSPCCNKPLSFETFNKGSTLAFIRCTGCSQAFTVNVDRPVDPCVKVDSDA